MYRNYLKYYFDFIFVIFLIVLISPILIIIFFLILLIDRQYPFFSHLRVGKNGKKFTILKFKTMKNNNNQFNQIMKDANKKKEWFEFQKISEDPRVTHLGKILRSYFLDELPQLFNILLGNMTFVGPRPIVDEEILKYGDSIIFYKKCKPGLTGLWQIKRTPSTNFKIRAKFDKEYYENISFIFDVKIMLSTFKIFLKAKGDWLDK
tara:strand:- start:50 stop:667 length:618 start_codon:yes stop_codon:yes gene_type:complete